MRLVRSILGPWRGIVWIPNTMATQALADGWAVNPFQLYSFADDFDPVAATEAAKVAVDQYMIDNGMDPDPTPGPGPTIQTLITSPKDGATVDPLVAITGTTKPDTEVYLFTNGGDHAQGMADADGNFTFSGSASLGAPGAVVTIQAKASGTKDSPIITVTVQEEAPPAEG